MDPVFAAGWLVTGVVLAGVSAPLWLRLLARFRGQREAIAATIPAVTDITQMLHLVLQGAPSGMCVVDVDMRVVVSNVLSDRYGITRGNQLSPELAAAVHQVHTTHEDTVITFAGPGGPSRVTAVRAHVQWLGTASGHLVAIYATDESEQQRMEQARRDFVANVSHELKTPVGGMALLSEAMVEAADDPAQVTHFAQQLTTEAHRLSSMVNELISLSKLQGAERLPEAAPIVVDDIIAAALQRNQVAADAVDITLTSDADRGQIVLGDRQLLITAVSNLVSNAIHYSPPHTVVSISQAIVASEDDPQTQRVAIRVTDRGIGIAKADQQRVFERFFRVDKARSRATGGTGLGLAIVKHVVANHGGTITVWSRPGTGSTFTIVLPIAPQNATAPTIVAGERSASNRRLSPHDAS
ncbi:sensor histidine kinase [Corynebacterium choanae]|uniref:Sensor-like histidine kinase SenX3 n=1 Tax=Corynebacterium choanae TaxID=1862358 RepID=A0A3G6J9N8_9CORY|nr:ATP-binding protein [Corynebacterium choanae]AZA14492.1 Signal-transduction histidine kinase senX3 [Corynebacterium choanae]